MQPVDASAEAKEQQGVGMATLYRENCANCHGDRGQGGGGGTRTLLTKELFDQEHDRRFFDAIKHGVPDMAMPAYGETMSDSQIWGLVVHVRELQARALRQEFGSLTPKGTDEIKSQHAEYRIETAVEEGEGLNTPWAIDWLPDGAMLITNRPGFMHVWRSGKLSPRIEGLPKSVEMGQGGLMEVSVHPTNGWIYLAINDPAPEGPGAMTKIVRGKLDLSGETPRWRDQETIYQAPAVSYTRAGVHFGSRIKFDGKGYMYFAIGDRGDMNKAQELNHPNGKIFRLHEDGRVPDDNPFVGQGDALPAIWSYGHRNPQGLVFDLQGNLWDTEHGPRGGDELNLIQKGANYGWPLVAFSINYNDSPFRTPWPAPDQQIAMPLYRWIPSIGASGLDVVRGNAFPQWRGDLVAGGLSGQNVDRIRIQDGKLVEREEILFGRGRVRDVRISPRGSVYVVLNGPDKIIRLVPNTR
jgi:aldose sugar dehydrogenase